MRNVNGTRQYLNCSISSLLIVQRVMEEEKIPHPLFTDLELKFKRPDHVSESEIKHSYHLFYRSVDPAGPSRINWREVPADL